jgi:hypothetical protein
VWLHSRDGAHSEDDEMVPPRTTPVPPGRHPRIGQPDGPDGGFEEEGEEGGEGEEGEDEWEAEEEEEGEKAKEKEPVAAAGFFEGSMVDETPSLSPSSSPSPGASSRRKTASASYTQGAVPLVAFSVSMSVRQRSTFRTPCGKRGAVNG